jgi:trimethylamine---corrinoid protein Co-methyltransferase
MIYGLGMLAQGITFDYAQLVIDNEIARMIKEVVGGIRVDKDTLALEVIHAVGAAGEYVSHEHTYNRFRDLASQNKLIYRGTRDRWEKDGSKDLTERAYEEALDIYNNYKIKPLSRDVVAKMRDIVNEAEEHFSVKLSEE